VAGIPVAGIPVAGTAVTGSPATNEASATTRTDDGVLHHTPDRSIGGNICLEETDRDPRGPVR
jgi:hypothetical protein